MIEEIKGEKISCEGHRIEKIRNCVQSDGHHGFCTTIKHGKCLIVKPFKWDKYSIK